MSSWWVAGVSVIDWWMPSALYTSVELYIVGGLLEGHSSPLSSESVYKVNFYEVFHKTLIWELEFFFFLKKEFEGNIVWIFF